MSEPAGLAGYERFEVHGDCGTFWVEYLPQGGKPQRMCLDAEDEAAALYEAAGIAGCRPEELEIIWH